MHSIKYSGRVNSFLFLPSSICMFEASFSHNLYTTFFLKFWTVIKIKTDKKVT